MYIKADILPAAGNLGASVEVIIFNDLGDIVDTIKTALNYDMDTYENIMYVVHKVINNHNYLEGLEVWDFIGVLSVKDYYIFTTKNSNVDITKI